MEYQEAKQRLAKDLRSLSNTKACLIYGDKAYTAAELAKEIEDETEVGKVHIQMYLDTMNRIKLVILNKPQKKWWQFWK